MPSESEQSKLGGWLRRLVFTPPGDLLRGKLTGRLDFERRFEAELGKPLGKHIGRIIHMVGLYPGEEIRAADELAEQCRRELEDGTSVERLIKRLKIRPTRKAIRRRYVRKRGWWGRKSDYLPLVFGGIVILWLACPPAYYYFSHPTMTVDYLALLNEPADSVPEKDRAWPGYREVILTLRADGETLSQTDEYGLTPGYPLWPDRVALINRHSETLVLLRETAMKPGLGLTVGLYGCYQGDDHIALYYPREPDPVEPEADHVKDWRDIDQTLWNKVMLPHLGMLRGLTRLLVSDAYIAVERGDADRFCEDITAMTHTAEHAAEIRYEICGFVGISNRNLAYAVITDVLVDDPGLLEKKHLAYLTEVLGEDSDGRLISMDGARIAGLDMIQRMYTDDGRGGGHLVPEVFQVLGASPGDQWWMTGGTLQRVMASIYLPSEVSVLPDRREFTRLIESAYRQSQRDLAVPMWRQDDPPATDEWDNLAEYGEPFRGMIYGMLPLEGVARSAIDRSDGIRNALLAGIALERYRRDYGDWPESLESLVPQYLTETPIDPITGGPAIYKVVGGLPLIYSVGVDRDDDGGRIPVNPLTGELDNQTAAQWSQSRVYPPLDGDWVLYPARPTLRESGASVVLPEDREPVYEYGSDGYGSGGYFSDSYGDHTEADSPDP